jgi:putative flippase GtrA
MVSNLINIRGDRYEYEMNVLLTCTKNNTLITEVPIDTIYHDQTNSCSHFRAVRDSLRIYGTILAFSGASLVSFLLDYLLFSILIRVIGLRFTEEIALIGANIGARFLSAGFNYYLNSTFVFRYKEKRARSLLRYIMLACFILILNTVILYCLHDYVGINKALAKLVTEMMLFVISFMVQKSFIFNKRRKQGVITL